MIARQHASGCGSTQPEQERNAQCIRDHLELRVLGSRFDHHDGAKSTGLGNGKQVVLSHFSTCSARPGQQSNVIRAIPLLLAGLCGGCMAVTHDSYFTPSSSSDHELRSPFPGSPWNSWPMFGSAEDTITLERKGVRLSLSVRTSACSVAWIGPVFLPVIPVRREEELDTSQLRIWIAVVPGSDTHARLNQFRVRLPDDPEGIPPTGVYAPSSGQIDTAMVNERHHVPGGDSKSWYLDFELPGPEPSPSFDLRVNGIITADGPLASILVHFPNVSGWRSVSLP